MINTYLKTIGVKLELLNQDDKPTIHLKDTTTYYRKTIDINLILLKWLISYQYPNASYKYYDGDFRDTMINSCKKLSLIDNSSASILSDDKYEELIYNYALNKIPSYDFASDYKILLYIYAILTTPRGTSSKTPNNSILSSIIGESEEELSLPHIRACIKIPIKRIKGVLIFKKLDDQKPIYKYKKSLPYQILHDYGKDIDFIEDDLGKLPMYFYKLNFVDLVIYILYLWFSDISTIAYYDIIMEQFKGNSDTTRKIVVNISDDNIKNLWEVCKNSASQYSYFYYKKKTSTHKKLFDSFKNFVTNITENNFVLAPSLITLFFNDMEPDKLSDRSDRLYEPEPYVFPLKNKSSFVNIPSLKWNNLSFLKMIILAPILSRNSQVTNNIEKRFEEEKLSISKKCDFNDTLKEYINSLEDRDREIAQHLFSSRKHDFYFTYLYFEIFLYVYEHRSMFKTNKKMDFALSVLHLNAATNWFDAFMLINDMPFGFRNYNFFYLKLLSVYPKFQPIIRRLSKIKFSITDNEASFGYNGQKIKFKNFLSAFYEKASEKLSSARLLDIAIEHYVNNSKTKMSLHFYLFYRSNRIHIGCINPIYKWIFLLEHNDISEERLEQICCSDYYDFLQEKADSTSWRTPITLPDPYSDGFDVYDSNNIF